MTYQPHQSEDVSLKVGDSIQCEAWNKVRAEVRALGVPASPAWCPTHQHYKWCEHNGGVMGPNGWQAPAGVEGRKP